MAKKLRSHCCPRIQREAVPSTEITEVTCRAQGWEPEAGVAYLQGCR